MIILHDHSRPWFARVLAAAGDSPDLAAPHSPGHSDTESTKA
jgi:hypothetical protein